MRPMPPAHPAIDELHVRSLGVLEEVSLDLARGLTVVTGETGAGKTMLVTALQLLLGARADAGLVRAGAQTAAVEARWSPAPTAAAAFTDDPDELIVGREVRAEGGSRARLGGRLVPAGALEELLGPLVEIHAQHQHLALTRPDVQRGLLDRFAGADQQEVLTTHAATWTRLGELRERRERATADARERTRAIDRAEFELAEIDAAQLDVDRDARLDDELAVLEHAEALAQAAARAAAALGEDGAGGPLGVAVDALRRLPADDPVLTAAHERVVGVTAEAVELAGQLRDRAEELTADPAALERLRARRAALSELFRRYGDDVADVLAHRDATAAELARLREDESDSSRLDARLTAAEQELQVTAEALRGARAEAGERLAQLVTEQLSGLGMPHARFAVELQPVPVGPTGADRVRFVLAPNPGEPAVPLDSAASGGERSRVALAVEVALADLVGARVLVFDEVDAGVGGATALAVGERLRLLAHEGTGRQVLCVTHLPQLAAFADVHHVVEKHVVGGRTVTRVRRVGDEERVGEVARMLGGDVGGEAGRAHAATLLEEARRRAA